MLKPGGYFVSADPDPTKSKGQVALTENDTITCGHGGELILVPPMCKPENMPYTICWGCRRFICLRCDDIRSKTLTCDVIEKKIERWEAKDRLRREVG